MVTATESRLILARLQRAAWADSLLLIPYGDEAVMDGGRDLIAAYSEATSVTAADYFDDAREASGTGGRFFAEPVILDRALRIEKGLRWACRSDTAARLKLVVESEVARPHRDTILENRRRDPRCVGWGRVTRPGACAFCRALADRGAVYKEATVGFAAHDHCSCAAQPYFRGEKVGPEADVMQYMASGRSRSPRERERMREWIAGYEEE